MLYTRGERKLAGNGTWILHDFSFVNVKPKIAVVLFSSFANKSEADTYECSFYDIY